MIFLYHTYTDKSKFLYQKRSLVVEECPNAGRWEIEARLKEIWCQIPEEHRTRYYQKAEKLTHRYSATAALGYMKRFKNPKVGRPPVKTSKEAVVCDKQEEQQAEELVHHLIYPIPVRKKQPEAEQKVSSAKVFLLFFFLIWFAKLKAEAT